MTGSKPCTNPQCQFCTKRSGPASGSSQYPKCAICRVSDRSHAAEFSPAELGGLIRTVRLIKAGTGREADLAAAMAMFDSVPGLRAKVSASIARHEQSETAKKKRKEAEQETETPEDNSDATHHQKTKKPKGNQ